MSRLIIILPLIPFFLSAQMDVERFNFQCVVSEQSIINLEDGKAVKFDRYKGGIKVGDSFTIPMETERFGKDDRSYYLRWRGLDDLLDNDPFYLSPGSIISTVAELTEYIGYDILVSDNANKMEVESTGKITNTGTLGIIGFTDILHIERYYKDDYEMVLMSLAPNNTTWVIHANCLNNKRLTKAIEDLFDSAKAYQASKK